MDSVAQDRVGMKRCAAKYGCGQWKPESEFWTGDKACKECRKKRKAAIESGTAPKMRYRDRDVIEMPPTPDAPQVAPSYAIMPYGGAIVAFEQDCSLVCITDIWRAAGSPESLRPAEWLRSDDALGLIAAFSRLGDMDPTHISQTRAGNAKAGAGTWLPKEIALAYAQRLNPDLWLACNRFILDRMRAPSPAQAPVLDREDRALLREMARRMGIITSIKQDTAAILGAVGSATVIHTEEVWKGQNYICRLVGSEYVALTRRQYKGIADDDDILFVGKTKPEGDVGSIRLLDYGGKWDLEPADYEVLAVFGSDEPGEVEKSLLQNPMHGCVRLIYKRSNQKSMTFIAGSRSAAERYRVFARRHYTLSAVRLLLCGIGGQLDLFGGAA